MPRPLRICPDFLQVPEAAPRGMRNIALNPVLEDAIVAISTTVGAWLIAHQLGWIFWG
jgi:hypothetical protein